LKTRLTQLPCKVLYHQAAKLDAKLEIARREKELEEQKAKYNIPEADS